MVQKSDDTSCSVFSNEMARQVQPQEGMPEKHREKSLFFSQTLQGQSHHMPGRDHLWRAQSREVARTPKQTSVLGVSVEYTRKCAKEFHW